MKQIFIIVMYSVLGVHLMDAQYTAVPDPNFEAYLEANGMGDGIPGNGLVLTANIENITELALTSLNISDFTGLEDFVALEEFTLGYNSVPITNFDLSNNVNLIFVGIVATQLSTLDLSNNNKLVSAGGLYNLELDTLIVNSPYVTQLDFWENHLTQIDISNCPALEILNVQYNFYLPSLDITNNPNLKTLHCGENNLSSLDTSNNPLLEVLTIGNNPNLTGLDLSNNPLLRIFTAGHNNSMTHIDVRNGNNENFELFSANPATNLQCVYVDDAEASYLEDWSVPNHTQFANNEQECLPVSVVEHRASLFSMYPNPAKERVTVLSKDNGNYHILSAEGKQLLKGVIVVGFNHVMLTELPAGMYYLQLETQERKEVKKVMKH